MHSFFDSSSYSIFLFCIKTHNNSFIVICYALYFHDVIYILTLGPKLRYKRHIKEQSNCVACDVQGAVMSLRII